MAKQAKPFVTVVIPACNRSEYIRKTLKSIRKQTYKNWKIIIADDASMDKIKYTLRAYLKKSNISLFQNELNRSISHVMNTALEQIDTKYFVQIDAGDWLESNALEILVAAMEKAPRKTAVAYGNSIVWRYGKNSELIKQKTIKFKSFTNKYELIKHARWMPNPCFFRTEVVKKVGGWPVNGPFDGKYMADLQICLKLIEHHHFLWLNENIYNRRKDEIQDTKSGQKIRNFIQEWTMQRTLQQWSGEYKAVLHYKHHVDHSHTTAQILHVPKYPGTFMVKQAKSERSDVFDKVYSYKNIGNFKQFIKRNHIAAVHAHHGSLGARLLHLKKEYGIPLITSFRGKDATADPMKDKYNDRFKELFKRGDMFFPVCHYLADRIRELGCPEDKIRVLYGGTDLIRFRHMLREYRENQPVRLLAIGRFVEKKGFHYLIPAFARVREKHPNTELLLIGKGNMEEEYKRQIFDLRLNESVHILNGVDYSNIQSVYHGAHIFCAPSCTGWDGNQEGIPNTLKEAMATGMPVIATQHAGIPELVSHNESGLLVREKDVDALAEAVCKLVRHPEKWEALGKCGRRKMEKDFDLYKQIKCQQRFYDEVLAP